jgi:hypothetical protein
MDNHAQSAYSSSFRSHSTYNSTQGKLHIEYSDKIEEFKFEEEEKIA